MCVHSEEQTFENRWEKDIIILTKIKLINKQNLWRSSLQWMNERTNEYARVRATVKRTKYYKMRFIFFPRSQKGIYPFQQCFLSLWHVKTSSKHLVWSTKRKSKVNSSHEAFTMVIIGSPNKLAIRSLNSRMVTQ